jgi:hypothetical protein
VTVTINPQPRGAAIPADFLGMSFGMRAVLPNRVGVLFFSPTNTQLVTLFRNLGLRHLRVGGTSVEWPVRTPIPNEREIDSLFAFARAAGIEKVIYSLRLLQTTTNEDYAAADVAIAKYIWEHYRPQLDCFSIGNEPNRQNVYTHDLVITNFATYLARWRQFAAAVTNAVPGAQFGGPDGGSANISWTINFAHAEKDAGYIKAITEHFYAGGAGRGVTVERGLRAMLSRAWITANQRLYQRMAEPVLADGLPYRFTEANDHYSGGVRGASDTFAGALWALDFLHWWAAHGTLGVDFHNTLWVVNDVITHDPNGRLLINPKGYGLKAFDLGSHGRVEPVTLSNPDELNLTAYAVCGTNARFLTLINKEHGAEARAAKVTVVAPGLKKGAAVIFLIAGRGGVAARSGVTLGGAPINTDGPWRGKWKPLEAGRSGQYMVKVPAVSAAIVRIPAP